MYNPDKECKEMIAAIERLCEQKNMTLYALSKKTGIATSTISYLIRGKTRPQVYTILVICNALGIRISDLFDDNAVSKEIFESQAQDMTYEEKKLIDCYRGLSDKKKDLLRIYLDMLRKYEDEQ